MSHAVYKSAAELMGFSVKNCAALPAPAGVLMCPPDHYEVRDDRNPFAAWRGGWVDGPLARKQWTAFRDRLQAAQVAVSLLAPAAGLGDMVFCASQAFAGLTTRGERLCLPGCAQTPARRREVEAFEAWFAAAGYKLARFRGQGLAFEGAADAVWHPGRRLIWGGYGFHSDAGAYEELARLFEASVAALKLVNEKFPYLNSCFCPLSQEAVFIYPSAFDGVSLELIFRLFPVIIAAPEVEAIRQMACGAVAAGKTVFVQRGASNAARHLAALDLTVEEVDGAEFIKRGGGLRSLAMPLY